MPPADEVEQPDWQFLERMGIQFGSNRHATKYPLDENAINESQFFHISQ